jgi:hypothetical protein
VSESLDLNKIVDFIIHEVREKTTSFQYIIEFPEVESTFRKFTENEKLLIQKKLLEDIRVADVLYQNNELDIVLYTDYV